MTRGKIPDPSRPTSASLCNANPFLYSGASLNFLLISCCSPSPQGETTTVLIFTIKALTVCSYSLTQFHFYRHWVRSSHLWYQNSKVPFLQFKIQNLIGTFWFPEQALPFARGKKQNSTVNSYNLCSLKIHFKYV